MFHAESTPSTCAPVMQVSKQKRKSEGGDLWASSLISSSISQLKTSKQGREIANLLEKEECGFHLAIMVKPFLQLLLEGKKTIESRFSKNRIPPYLRVNEGDLIFFKASGGPVVAIAQVLNTWYFELDPATVSEIRENYGDSICALDPTFWENVDEDCYASLFRISPPIKLEPLSIKKRDMRPWVIMKSCTSNELF